MVSLPANAAAYVKGLLCVFENANCVSLSRIAQRSHDSLTRVLVGRTVPWQTLLEQFLASTFGKLQGGWLMIDDTVITKPFARMIEGLAWVYDSEAKRSILGLNIVLVAWSNGALTIPLALRVYRAKSGKTKIDLALSLMAYCRNVLRLRPDFITFDCWYSASAILRRCDYYGWTYVTVLKKNRKLNGVSVRKLHRHPYWIERGTLEGGISVLVVRNGKKYFATNNCSFSRRDVLNHYRGRWLVETIFRALHSKLGLDECESRSLTAQTAHFHLCLMAYCVLGREGYVTKRTVYDVKQQCSFNFRFADELLTKLHF